jgi:photosystem II stability/assembly factor-like uncharacterized protein
MSLCAVAKPHSDSTTKPQNISASKPYFFCDNSRMRFLLILLAATTAFAQPSRQTQSSNTTESLRGVSAVSTQVAWASGTHGTYLRTTDGGHTWIPSQVPEATTLDFRGIVAFSPDEAFLMSAGSGDQSRIYHTTDAGLHWKLQFTATNPKSFFDSIAFWDHTHGIVLGDPILDDSGRDSGQLKFELLITDDGQTWTHIPPSQLPPALEAEGAFAASNTSLAILSNPVILSGDIHSAERSECRSRRTPCISSPPAASQGVPTTDAVATNSQIVPASWQNAAAPLEPGFIITIDPAFIRMLPLSDPYIDPNIWFATGGRAARVFHSSDRGRTWQVFSTPIAHGPDSAGIFSIAFRDPLHGVIAGGDYKHPDQDGPNLAFTNDGGKTWSLSQIFPQSYYSAVAYDRTYPAPDDNQAHSRLFLVSPKSFYDFRPPQNPTRISPPKKSGIQFNAVSPYPTGGALFVGPHGSIATIP